MMNVKPITAQEKFYFSRWPEIVAFLQLLLVRCNKCIKFKLGISIYNPSTIICIESDAPNPDI